MNAFDDMKNALRGLARAQDEHTRAQAALDEAAKGLFVAKLRCRNAAAEMVTRAQVAAGLDDVRLDFDLEDEK